MENQVFFKGVSDSLLGAVTVGMRVKILSPCTPPTPLPVTHTHTLIGYILAQALLDLACIMGTVMPVCAH